MNQIEPRAELRTSSERRAQPLALGEAQEYARLILPFAAVANYTYRDKRKAEARAILNQYGWNELIVEPTALLSEKERASGLGFAVFYREIAAKSFELVFGFRGTDFSSLSDWRSNLRWFTRFFPGQDQYEIVYARKKELLTLAMDRLHEKNGAGIKVDIFATGHSLGGGLAQMFAYANTAMKGAIVFDSSPVTGYLNIVEDAEVNCAAGILRVYERGEVLQYVRSFLRRFYDISSNIAEVSFNLLEGNPIVNHSMKRFYDALQRLGENAGPVAQLPSAPNCNCYRKRKSAIPESWPAACRVNA